MNNAKNEGANHSKLFDRLTLCLQHRTGTFIKIIVITLVLLLVSYISQREIYFAKRDKIETFLESHKIENGNIKPIYLIYNDACKIFNHQPRSSKAFKKPKPKSCLTNNKQPFVSSDDEFIWVNEQILESNGIYDNISCCYYEVNSLNNSFGCPATYNYNKFCKPFWNKTKVDAEFLMVNCAINKKVIYVDYHLFVPRKEDVDTRCETLSKTQDRLNVLVLGLDSISRPHFHRTMSKTADYLVHNLSAIEMFGYNKVGEDTIPNMLAATTGQHREELKSGCALRGVYLDTCRFIWDDYKLSGYRTALLEEPMYCFTLKSRTSGFCRPPTDYYSTHFIRRAVRDATGKYCYGVRLRYETLLTYVDRFVRSSDRFPYFGFFFHNSFTHEGFNNGHLIDDAYHSYIKNLSHLQSFNNTVLIVLSDHGFSYEPDYMLTEAGRMEFKLPLMFFVFPPWFQQKYSTAVRNMKENVRRLTTPFDFYETLKDLIDYPEKLNDSVLENRNSNLTRINGSTKLPRGISLFLRIPKQRTCEDAGIHWHYCACVPEVAEDVESPVVQYLSAQLVNYINLQVVSYPQCAKVRLRKVVNAGVFRVGNTSFVRHRVTLTTNPGPAIYTFTARGVENNFRKFKDSLDYVLESITRNNKYSHESYCIDEYEVQRFCYCKVQH